jgi:3-oxoacyl-(acyl-carrier-protein) synthase
MYGPRPPRYANRTTSLSAGQCIARQGSVQEEVRVAVSNSFGFGGSNTCLVLRAV